ncbi:SDR family NAD(P)-dependent oxidoreductase [Pseudonocardia hierapolitana]|uniref:SDR family NAD(P)-dependent oxidoreductase n=1 Tax=Pseudonocardia hierapolitana TaxID=1128676 RepID=UPI001FE7D318|nr:SDR family NAD(P)-dependent oxidoreductase [Pseudonocardia hierapolitana]
MRRIFAVNVLAHVHATRAVLPSMLERGRGHLMTVASRPACSRPPATPPTP